MDITVAIPVYNERPQHIMEAVYSIVNQTYDKRFRFLLVDDCSTEQDTIDIIEYLSRSIEVIRMNENVGLSAVLNHVLEISDTEYVFRMDADDVCHRSRIADQVDFLKGHPEVDVLGTNLFGFCDTSIKRDSLFTTRHPEHPDPHVIPEGEGEVNRWWLVNHATVAYRKSAVLAVGGYDESLRRQQDVDLWQRMFDNGATFRNLEAVYYGWRRFC